jgi:hypothetical protein
MNQFKSFNASLVILILLYTLISCDNRERISGGTANQSENKSSHFMSNEQVELLIKDKDPIFIHYWIGMTRKEEVEVTRYLLAKEVISGIVHNPDEDTTSVKRCVDFSLDVHNKCGFVEFNVNNYHLLKSSESKKLFVLIDHTLFEMEFIYKQLDSLETLSEIHLSAVSKINTISDVTYNDFITISKLYIEKYGSPSKSNLNNRDSGFCIFTKESNTVDISFHSDNIPPPIEGYDTPSQIHIRYFNEDRLRNERVYQKNSDDKIKKENDLRRQKLEEKVHSESLQKI